MLSPDLTMLKNKAKEARELDIEYVWHPFTQMKEWVSGNTPIIIERGEGNCLIDTNGKRYLDGVASLWVNIHGHRRREIDDAIVKQLGLISHSTLLGLGNVPSSELARRLVEVAPEGLSKVFYSDNGSTAVEVALKMAVQYWNQIGGKGVKAIKNKFVAFTGAYHGDTLGAMGVGEIGLFVHKFRPLISPAFRAVYPYCYRCPVDDKYPACSISCLDRFRNIVEEHHSEIAACIVEPMVQGAAGMIVSPEGFLKQVEQICKKYSILLIADEVATGFGRTGTMFACEHEKVKPDFLCVAKGITGGYIPLAATLTSIEIYDAFLGEYEDLKTFFHGHTYTGNQLGCAAAIANLELFRQDDTINAIQPKIDYLALSLRRFSELKHVGETRQLGMMAGVELVKNRQTKERYPLRDRVGAMVCKFAAKKGLIIRPIGDVVIILPPLSITIHQLQEITETVYEAISAVTEQ